MHADDLRRWTHQRQLGARRELAEMRDAAPSPEEAFANGLRMIALAGRLHGWPLLEDERAVEEELEVYRRWARLRRRLSEA